MGTEGASRSALAGRRVLLGVTGGIAAYKAAYLARRLRQRRTESEPELARRLTAAREEMAQAAWFDHVVVNDDADRAAAEVASIIEETRSH